MVPRVVDVARLTEAVADSSTLLKMTPASTLPDTLAPNSHVVV